MSEYQNPGPTRDEIDSKSGAVVVQFGTEWCSFCTSAEPLIAEALGTTPSLQWIKVEDGPGRRLGRSFKIKLWPSLIFLKDGKEVARVVRPNSVEEIRIALRQIDPR